MNTMPIAAPRQAGIYVRRAREAQGLTRAQLATASGVSVRSLASLEIGEAAGIRLDKLLAIYQALGLSLVTQGEHIASAASLKTKRRKQNKKPSQKKHAQHPAGKSPGKKSDSVSYNEALRDFIIRNAGIAAEDDARRPNSLNER